MGSVDLITGCFGMAMHASAMLIKLAAELCNHRDGGCSIHRKGGQDASKHMLGCLNAAWILKS